MRNEDVIAKLRSVSGGGYPVKLVIARKMRGEDPEDVQISDVHVSREVYEIHSVHCAFLIWGEGEGAGGGGREGVGIWVERGKFLISSFSSFSLQMMRLRNLRLKF